MSICDGPMTTCGGTQEAIIEYSSTFEVNQKVDRKITLKAGRVSIDINVRNRNYTYTKEDITKRSNFKFVVSRQIQNHVAECYTVRHSLSGVFDEDYETIDCTFHYVDLRNDILVYTETTQHMVITKENSGHKGDSSGDMAGSIVAIQTGFDDTYMTPFIFEEVPISIDKKIICTTIGEIHTEHIDSGYFDGIRVLMPSFLGGNPRPLPFTIDNNTYNAGEVDWYYIPSHLAHDGDAFFWWADWHAAMGINNEIDADEASKFASIFNPSGDYTSLTGLSITDFLGSIAIDGNNNILMSMSFNGYAIIINKLIVNGVEVPFPTETIKIKDGDSYKDQESEHTIWYPASPI